MLPLALSTEDDQAHGHRPPDTSLLGDYESSIRQMVVGYGGYTRQTLQRSDFSPEAFFSGVLWNVIRSAR